MTGECFVQWLCHYDILQSFVARQATFSKEPKSKDIFFFLYPVNSHLYDLFKAEQARTQSWLASNLDKVINQGNLNDKKDELFSKEIWSCPTCPRQWDWCQTSFYVCSLENGNHLHQRKEWKTPQPLLDPHSSYRSLWPNNDFSITRFMNHTWHSHDNKSHAERRSCIYTINNKIDCVICSQLFRLCSQWCVCI